MSLQKTLGNVHKKAGGRTKKTQTIFVDPERQMFFVVPDGYLLTFVWLGGTTYTPKLYKI